MSTRPSEPITVSAELSAKISQWLAERPSPPRRLRQRDLVVINGGRQT